MKDDSKVNNWDDRCRLKAGVYRCALEVDGPLWLDDTWAYNVRVDRATGCWTARTVDRFGANQAAIDEWRNRESLPALTDKADVRRMVREAERPSQPRRVRRAASRLPPRGWRRDEVHGGAGGA